MHLSSIAAEAVSTRSCEQPVSLCFPVRSVSAVPAKCCFWSFLFVQSCSLCASLGFQHHKRTGVVERVSQRQHPYGAAEPRDSVLLHAGEGVWGGKCDSGSLEIKTDRYQTGFNLALRAVRHQKDKEKTK